MQQLETAALADVSKMQDEAQKEMATLRDTHSSMYVNGVLVIVIIDRVLGLNNDINRLSIELDSMKDVHARDVGRLAAIQRELDEFRMGDYDKVARLQSDTERNRQKYIALREAVMSVVSPSNNVSDDELLRLLSGFSSNNKLNEA